MKLIYKALKFTLFAGALLFASACNYLLEGPVQNETFN